MMLQKAAEVIEGLKRDVKFYYLKSFKVYYYNMRNVKMKKMNLSINMLIGIKYNKLNN